MYNKLKIGLIQWYYWKLTASDSSLALGPFPSPMKYWESLGLQEIKPVSPKGNQPWIFIGRTDAEAEAPILWPPDAKNWVIGEDPDADKDWGQEEKGTTEDEMVGWRHPLNGQKFEQASGNGEGQRGLVCCSPWGHKQLDTTEQLNNSNEVLAVKVLALKQWFWKELQHYQEGKEHRSGIQTGLPHSSQSLSSWSQLWLHISSPNIFYCFQHKLWRLWTSNSQIEYDLHIPA